MIYAPASCSYSSLTNATEAIAQSHSCSNPSHLSTSCLLVKIMANPYVRLFVPRDLFSYVEAQWRKSSFQCDFEDHLLWSILSPYSSRARILLHERVKVYSRPLFPLDGSPKHVNARIRDLDELSTKTQMLALPRVICLACWDFFWISNDWQGSRQCPLDVVCHVHCGELVFPRRAYWNDEKLKSCLPS